MKKYIQAILFGLCSLLFFNAALGKGLSEENGGLSVDNSSEIEKRENMERTSVLIDKVEDYLKQKDAYVGIIARRGAGNPDTGVSDTDGLDLSGMAHCGFVVRNGFGKNAGYMTFNLVRIKGGKKENGKTYDVSELRAWSLPQFFIGTFEKDAIVFLPEKKVQLKLWNLLRANGQLKVESRQDVVKDRKGNIMMAEDGSPKTITRQVISNGAFVTLHNAEYNLLSDYVDGSTQNCNEHLLKTYIGFRDYWQPKTGAGEVMLSSQDLKQFRLSVRNAMRQNYKPRRMTLSRTKSTFAFTQNIRFSERHAASPTLLGLKLRREKFDVVSVDSFCDPKNQQFLGWNDFKVFREHKKAGQGWVIEDWDRNYVKKNRFTGKKNRIAVM